LNKNKINNFFLKKISEEMEEFQFNELIRVSLKDSIFGFLERQDFKSKLKKKKLEMRINLFQIDKMRINAIFVNDENILKYKEKCFLSLNENYLKNQHTLLLKVEIELVPFGKVKFYDEETRKKNENKIEKIKKRCVDDKGNVFFLLNGKKKKFFFLNLLLLKIFFFIFLNR
jgi:hypothetical protein